MIESKVIEEMLHLDPLRKMVIKSGRFIDLSGQYPLQSPYGGFEIHTCDGWHFFLIVNSDPATDRGIFSFLPHRCPPERIIQFADLWSERFRSECNLASNLVLDYYEYVGKVQELAGDDEQKNEIAKAEQARHKEEVRTNWAKGKKLDWLVESNWYNSHHTYPAQWIQSLSYDQYVQLEKLRLKGLLYECIAEALDFVSYRMREKQGEDVSRFIEERPHVTKSAKDRFIFFYADRIKSNDDEIQP